MHIYVHGIIEGTKTNRNISIVLNLCCFYNEGSIIWEGNDFKAMVVGS